MNINANEPEMAAIESEVAVLDAIIHTIIAHMPEKSCFRLKVISLI
jgi:hypothetical protein